ncbi:MAG: NERD domain-containing protein [Salinibacterium sp.]|nr:NERD domain-containing protein [Salinibacterium sp.]
MQHSRTLRERVAGQSAMAAVVRAQYSAPVRGRLARILGVSPLTFEARQHYRGALGELVVGDVLENLGPTWDVLHDLPLDGSAVDHLLIGRAGTFTVHAVNYGRNEVIVDGVKLSVDGEPHLDISSAADEAAEVSRLLSLAAGKPVRVRPLLVVVDPARLTVRKAPRGVKVISSGELAGVLAHAPRTLTGEEVANVSDLADLESTWPAADAVDLDTQQLHRDFGTIRSAVNDALVRRILWAAAATIVVYASVCSVIAAFVTVVVRN